MECPQQLAKAAAPQHGEPLAVARRQGLRRGAQPVQDALKPVERSHGMVKLLVKVNAGDEPGLIGIAGDHGFKAGPFLAAQALPCCFLAFAHPPSL